ncbi:hypothetical protein [Cryptosporangium aurantiacum]|uniref:Uncharacterized protein n=1 Tax=Cryptosporangium aurantiacum TaxID=134849 RepID=A0A1M7RBF6_9ACTN|nr:hypothetical protein [Cryptosporangium aurantiacum]SHN43617.1 hypothetical protein SAMN05443668_109276 [Cryptosporangium aurantiacum]
MTHLPPPPRDLPPGVHTALRARVLDGTSDEADVPQRRRWLLPLAAAAAVLVVMFGAIGLFRSDPSTPDPVATARPVTAPTSFDPRFTRATPGWLPDGVTVETHAVSPTIERLRTAGGEVLIELIPRDGRTDLDAALAGAYRPGPSINGKRSVWLPPHGAGDTAGWLGWEWAPGAGAVILIQGVPDGERVAARIAASLRPGEPKPLALPFTLTRPADLPLAFHSVAARKSGGYAAALEFEPGTGSVVHVGLEWLPERYAAKTYPPNGTIGGRDANTRVEGEDVVVWQRFGSDVAEVRCRKGKGAAIDVVRAECQAVAASLRPAGENDDPSTWSTEPLG